MQTGPRVCRAMPGAGELNYLAKSAINPFARTRTRGLAECVTVMTGLIELLCSGIGPSFARIRDACARVCLPFRRRVSGRFGSDGNETEWHLVQCKPAPSSAGLLPVGRGFIFGGVINWNYSLHGVRLVCCTGITRRSNMATWPQSSPGGCQSNRLK